MTALRRISLMYPGTNRPLPIRVGKAKKQSVGGMEAAKRQMDADLVSITLFEQGIRQLDDPERYVVVGRCAKRLKWEDFTYPDSGKKMSSNKVSSLLHSGLQNLADVMLDMFSYALEACD